MLYDMRTYTLKNGSLGTVEKLFEDAMPVREKYSRLGGFFHAESGVLNQIVHIWPYENFEHLQKTRALAAGDSSGQWPPVGLSEHIVTMESQLLQSAPFMDDWTGPRELGSIYELRTYSLLAGSTPAVLKEWGAMIGGREEFSPLAACWTPAGTGGPINRLIHLWAYPDYAARAEARAAATASGKWPPPTGQYYTQQESKILAPASFSPMH